MLFFTESLLKLHDQSSSLANILYPWCSYMWQMHYAWIGFPSNYNTFFLIRLWQSVPLFSQPLSFSWDQALSPSSCEGIKIKLWEYLFCTLSIGSAHWFCPSFLPPQLLILISWIHDTAWKCFMHAFLATRTCQISSSITAEKMVLSGWAKIAQSQRSFRPLASGFSLSAQIIFWQLF